MDEVRALARRPAPLVPYTATGSPTFRARAIVEVAYIASAKWKGVVASETCTTTPVAPTTTLTSMRTVFCP